MPYKIVEEKGEWCVYTHDAQGQPVGKTHGCHPSKAEAEKQMAAMYVNVPDATKSGARNSGNDASHIKGIREHAQAIVQRTYDLGVADDPVPTAADVVLAHLNGVRSAARLEFKSLPDGTMTVGGYGILWGGADLGGETFQPDTDLALDMVPVKTVYYDHTLDPTIGDERLGTVTKVDVNDLGVWFEAQLDKAGKYAAHVKRLVEQGVVGMSTGSAAHLIRKTGQTLKRWPIIELSLTPTPFEPRTIGVDFLRSMATANPALKALVPEVDVSETPTASAATGETKAIGDATSVKLIPLGGGNMTENAQPTIDVSAIVTSAVEAALKSYREKLEAEPPAVKAGFTIPAQVRDSQEGLPYKSFGEQLQDVAHFYRNQGSAPNPRLLAIKAALGANEGVPSDGGFLVQQDFSAELIKRSYAFGEISRRVRSLPISANSNSMKLNGIDETSRASTRWGGILAYWLAEAGTKLATKPKWRKMELNLHKLIGSFYATDELLADAATLESWITQGFTEEFAFRVEDAFYRGTGVDQPLGVLNSPCLITVAKEGAQAADTVVSQNIIKMRAQFYAASRANSVWLINQELEPQLATMFIAVGASGIPIYMPATGLSGTQYDTLYGRPVIPVEYCSALGDLGDIMLTDWSQYLTITKGGMQAASSIHVAFMTDETVFRFVYRVDGQPLWNSTLTPYKGTNALSPFVTLAAR